MKRFNQKKIYWIAAIGLTLCAGGAWTASAAPSDGKFYRRLQLFASVLSLADRFYVEPVDGEALVVGAVQGMVRTLDPHSALLTPDDFAMLEADTQGEFGGVGLEVGVKDNIITVIAPMEGSPADRAGIEPGDRLIEVDGKDAATMSIEDAVRLMRGKVGTAVTAVFLRTGKKEPVKVKLVREIIQVKSVETEMILPGYAWIRVRQFQDGTTAEVKKAVREAEQKAGLLRGILLDFRRNPGGVLDEAVRLSDLFLHEGVIVTTQGRGGEAMDRYNAHRMGTIRDLPLVVLIDEASASAAEIVAGALQDQGRALLVGNRSFGKGSVQSILPLKDGYGLKLTIARYYTPGGRSIQAEGITPDILIESKIPPPRDDAVTDFPSEADLQGSLAAAVPEKAAGGNLVEIEDYQLRIGLQLLVAAAKKKDG